MAHRFPLQGQMVLVALLIIGAAVGDHVYTLATLPALLPIRSEADTRPVSAVVRIEGVRGSVLFGRSSGNVQVVSPDGGAVADENGAFRVPVPVAPKQEVLIALPPGAQFFASRSGKVYYSVRGKGGSTIKPENRVYFSSAAEAEAAGYRLPK